MSESPKIMDKIQYNLELETKASLTFQEMIKIPEITEALDLLDSLEDDLYYHNKNHTLDVIRDTIIFAVFDGADDATIRVASIAAAWHDTGFLKQRQKNEGIAVELFKESEAYKNLSEQDRLEIIANIMDTQMLFIDGKPSLQQQGSIHGYILDADVGNFGRDDYFEKRQRVAKELKIDLSNPEAKKKFYNFSTELLRNHSWKTKSAKLLRDEKKEENLSMAEVELVSLT